MEAILSVTGRIWASEEAGDEAVSTAVASRVEVASESEKGVVWHGWESVDEKGEPARRQLRRTVRLARAEGRGRRRRRSGK